MSYVSKKEFGWSQKFGWLNGDEESYKKLVAIKAASKPRPGRERNYPVHPSWSEVLQHFNTHDRSQRAFCRWAGINPATFSAKKNKPLSSALKAQIEKWVWVGDGEGLEGGWGTEKDRA